ncbi:molybdenum cofactor guanylyltransferase [Lutimaribacter sp. EGI FJ00015]|uniref:Molybdenum cofactor guanylyltransferase n=1 Tax=Lutimaribacter degradans TaxID=2945989 RepID=A0ACC5ZVG6_9RHOB|nr:molybdenum cofactor guanylyltransferase MobA [Lutimaribacter sp. EGI FJ00013]MCM2562095.1 molybdenum cofactor guanylyltransferase [Lutimaribacter sp. EGI FJ00013]MCO0613248.1 molybdenum cofactor guanylyltransferase [Lutimaribacter sp. EGI FJ00015]MCO0636225.1 molybdenum cofactor guanylyltransferase [Lutimaribacter sp. EGI FJ00014]
MTDPIPAVIVAGGLASRMGGGDKALLPLGNARVIDHLLARLRPQVGDIALNANGVPDRWADLGVPVLPDPVPDRPGPLAGILAAMQWARCRGATQVLTVAGDTPFLPGDLVTRLRTPGAAAYALDRHGRAHPVCGIWPVTCEHELRQRLARREHRMMAFCHAIGAAPVAFPDPAPPAFFNINTPQELEQAARWLTPADQPISASPGSRRS